MSEGSQYPKVKPDPVSSTLTRHDDLLWAHLKSMPAFRGLLRAVEARFYRNIVLPEPVLDLGCGDGIFAELTFDKRIKAGIDPWRSPLVKAAKGESYDAAVQGLGSRLPFADGYFGSAISNSVLEHIEDLPPVLDEVYRVLGVDGRFVVTMPSHLFSEKLRGAQILEKMHFRSFAGGYRTLFNRLARHAHVDPPEIWAARFARAGFTVDRWQYYFSEKALHALEIGHLQGVPSAMLHAITGSWIVAPWESNLKYTEAWLRPYYEEMPPQPGTMLLFVLRKGKERPTPLDLPGPNPIRLYEDPPVDLLAVPTPNHLSMGQPEVQLEEVAVPGRQRRTAAVVRPPSIIEDIRKAPRRRWLLIGSIFLMVIAYQASNNTPGADRSTLSILSWLLAMFTAAAALFDKGTSGSLRPLTQAKKSWEIPVVIAIFAVALVLRIYDLNSHPFIISGSEASIGLDAAAIADGRIQSPFSTAWLTNPSLPFYILAIPVSLLGKTTLAVRILSPLIGAATIVVVYFFGRRLWGPRIGLVASLLLMGSHMHIHYSRLGMTNIWEPLLITSSLGLIYSAWQSRNRSLWMAAGIVTGLNAYLYTPSHILPLILVGLFLFLLLDWHELVQQRSNLFAAVMLAIIVALPQLLFYQANPAIFMERAEGLGIVQSGWYLRESEVTGRSPSRLLLNQIIGGVTSVLVGQDNSVAYSPGATFFGFWASLLMVVGVVLSLLRWRQMRYAILLLWIGISVLFAGALLESPPQSHRLLIILPAAYLLLTIGLFGLVGRALKLVGLSSRHLVPIVVTAIAVIILGDILFYFGEYRNQYRYGDRNTEIAHELSLYLDNLEGQWVAYFYGAPSMYTSFPTFAYLIDEYGTDLKMVDVFEPGSFPAALPGSNIAYIFLPEKQADLQRVQELYPGGKLEILPGHHASPLSYIYQFPNSSS